MRFTIEQETRYSTDDAYRIGFTTDRGGGNEYMAWTKTIDEAKAYIRGYKDSLYNEQAIHSHSIITNILRHLKATETEIIDEEQS